MYIYLINNEVRDYLTNIAEQKNSFIEGLAGNYLSLVNMNYGGIEVVLNAYSSTISKGDMNAAGLKASPRITNEFIEGNAQLKAIVESALIVYNTTNQTSKTSKFVKVFTVEFRPEVSAEYENQSFLSRMTSYRTHTIEAFQFFHTTQYKLKSINAVRKMTAYFASKGVSCTFLSSDMTYGKEFPTTAIEGGIRLHCGYDPESTKIKQVGKRYVDVLSSINIHRESYPKISHATDQRLDKKRTYILCGDSGYISNAKEIFSYAKEIFSYEVKEYHGEKVMYCSKTGLVFISTGGSSEITSFARFDGTNLFLTMSNVLLTDSVARRLYRTVACMIEEGVTPDLDEAFSHFFLQEFQRALEAPLNDSLRDAEHDLANKEMQLDQASKTLIKLSLSIRAERNQAEFYRDSLKDFREKGISRWIEDVMDKNLNPELKSYAIKDDYIIFRTEPLYMREYSYKMKRTGNKFFAGVFDICTRFSQGQEGKQLIWNRAVRVRGFRDNMNHPHGFNHGGQCLGSWQSSIAGHDPYTSMGTRIRLFLDFLQTCNIEDTAGKHFGRWPLPIIPEEAEFIKTAIAVADRAPLSFKKNLRSDTNDEGPLVFDGVENLYGGHVPYRDSVVEFSKKRAEYTI